MLFWPAREDIPALNRFFLPLMVVGGGVFGSVLSAVIVGAMLICALLMLRGVTQLPQNNDIRKIGWCLAFFFVAELLSGVVNFSGAPTLMQFVENLPFLGFMPLYASIRAERNDIRDGIEKLAIGCSFAVCVLAVIQFHVFGTRALGAAGNQGVFGVMCLLLVAVNFLTVLRHHRIMRALAGLALLAAACALILSGMRSLWPGFLIVPAVLFVIYSRHLHFRPTKGFLSASFILLALLGLALYAPARERVVAGLQDIQHLGDKNYATSLGQRLVIWRAGWDLLKEKPFLGQGPDKAERLLIPKSKEIGGMPLYFNHYHNALLTYGVRGGLLGALALLAVFAVPLVVASKNLSDEISVYGFALLVGLELSYILSGLFGIALGHDIMDTVFIATLAVALYMIFGGKEGQSQAAIARAA
jgi:O-antigen ligase